jgi:L-iduronidase
MQLTCHFDQPSVALSTEWRWTGFTPARLLLDDDMRQTLRYLGAVPRGGVRHVRIHYLLDLVTAKGLDSDAPLYDWSKLDKGLDALVENRLIPFFELMGNPARTYFTDFRQREQALAWKSMVRDLALHLQERYGRSAVEQWYFETWNEPDCGWWPQSVDNFLIYYDACSEGLREANPALRFGGPGTAHTLSPEIKALLAHVDTGANHLTGERPVRMDFLSVHEKGCASSVEDLPVSPERMVGRVRQLRAYLAEHHPRLLQLPLMNNECDPQVGWQDPHTWRATPFYPAIMTKGLFLHLEELVDRDGADLAVFGNDNGFIGGWPQRTQLARIAVKGRETEFFELVKKPALNLMTALSLAGTRRVPCTVDADGSLYGLATLLPDGQGAAVFACRADNRCRAAGIEPLRITLAGLAPGAYTLVQYRIDEYHGNPYRVWEELVPDTSIQAWLPDPEVLRQLRQQQELARFGAIGEVLIGTGEDAAWEARLDLPLPGLHVLLLLRKEAFAPPQGVTDLRAEPYHGLDHHARVLISWQPPEAHSVVDHRIEWRVDSHSPWQAIDHPPLLDGSLVHLLPHGCRVPQYRVTPLDAWGRGPIS